MKYPVQIIEVEFDSRGQRVRKAFIDHYQARRFYAAMLKAGKHPKVIKGKQ